VNAASLELRDVGIDFDDRAAIRGVSLKVEPGEVLVVAGPSGAGKTTFLRCINGTIEPTAGEVLVDGVDLATLGPRDLRRARSRVGFVHQSHSLVPNLRVSQNVVAGRIGQQGVLGSIRSLLWPRRAELEQAHALLERVGIPEKLFQRTDTLSGGQQQRVALARALYQRPSLLLADEPVASVDPARAKALVELMLEVARERDLTLVVSLHDLELARAYFPRCLGLREGRVLFDRATEDVPEADFEELYRLEREAPRG
jgi:phosphonate transport system ATP-binding protein